MPRDKTVCPKCRNHFPVEGNRKYQLKYKYSVTTFFQLWKALKQFHYFNHVKCPVCHNIYIAKEARLFCVFSSPYKIYLIAILIDIALFVWMYFDWYKP